MEARPQRVSMLLAATCLLSVQFAASPFTSAARAASCRSEHFIVSAPTPDFARQVCEAAEQFRRDLAVEWLGKELPPWQDICPIQVLVGPHLGAGGATTFTFIKGQPRDWHMEIQGSRERIIDSVLPHEVTHTIFATHFGRPLPRWADEGAATSVEHVSERTKQDQLLIQFLTSNRGIAFNQMFAMTEYPPDILPLYSQGYSLARYLVAQGGKRKFVDYVYDGMRGNNWTAATHKHYGLTSLSALQINWLSWVRQGSPKIEHPTPNALVESAPRDTPTSPAAMPPHPLASAESPSKLVPLPASAFSQLNDAAQARPLASDSQQGPSDSVSLSWYSQQRDLMGNSGSVRTTELRPATAASSTPAPIPASRSDRRPGAGTMWR
ncbi:MAG: hypothetical protein ACYC6N_28880 [Pirellulaceae bacterium]